jgi:hypothetical protein
MPTPTPTEWAQQSHAAHGDAGAESTVIEVSGGRTAAGDRRPAARPAVAPVGPAPASAAKPAKMGCSGYRIKHGTSDEAIVKAIRQHAAESVAETEGSLWTAASSLTDDQLLAVIGWSFIAETACARVAKHLSGMAR